MESSAAVRASFAGLLALASCGALVASPDPRSGVTIRSRGANVIIEGDRGRFSRRFVEPGREALAEAARRKQKGADDAAIVAYLRARRADLPSVIDLADVTRLRRAGAGSSVIGYLASVAAVEVGPTGEGGTPAPTEPVEPQPLEAPSYAGIYGVSGYPAYSSAPYGLQRHFRPHRVHRERPFPHRPLSPRVMRPRFRSAGGIVPRAPFP